MRTRAIATAAVAAVLPLFALASPAQASDDPADQLRGSVRNYDPSADSTKQAPSSAMTWREGVGDSPRDADASSLFISIAPSQDGTYDYAELYTSRSLMLANQHVTSSDLGRLGFDMASAYGGGVRLVVQLRGGTRAELTGAFCHRSLGYSGWMRAGFTKAGEGCAFYDNHGQRYASTATRSAWDAFAAAHPTEEVSATYLVSNEVGIYSLDRVALGTGVCYTNGPVSVRY